MKITFFILLFLSSAMLWAQKVNNVGNIRGKVTDKNTGKNLANATLEILDNKKIIKKVDTDEDGTYVINDIPAGIYTLQCKAPNHISQRIESMPIKYKDEKLAYFRLRQGDERNPPEIIATYASIQAKLNTQVSSASLYATSLFDAPANIYIFDQKDIDERGFMSLIELLETVPEVEIQYGGSFEHRNLITLRGTQGSGHFLLLLDGVRINSLSGSAGIVDKNISIRYAKQVEVIVGSTSAVYGADAVSGVINIISDHGESGLHVQGSQSAGNFGTHEGAAHVSYKKEDFSVMAAGSFYNSKEPFLPNYYKDDTTFAWYRNHYSQDGTMLLWTGLSVEGNDAVFNYDTVDLGDPVAPDVSRQAYFMQAQLKYKNLETGFQRNQQTFSGAYPFDSRFSTYTKDNKQGQFTTNFYIKQRWSAMDNKLNFSTVLNFNRQAQARGITQIGTNSNYLPTYSSGYDNNFEARQLLSYQCSKNHTLYGGIVFVLSNSLGLLVGLPKPFNTDSTAREQDLYYLGTGGAYPKIYRDVYYADRTYTSSNIQYEGRLSKKWSIGASIRYDYISTNSTLKHQFWVLSPKLHLIYRANEKWRLKFLLRNNIMPPSMQRSFYHTKSFVPYVDSSGTFQTYVQLYNRAINPRLSEENNFFAEFMSSRATRNWQASVNTFAQISFKQITSTYTVDTAINNIPVVVSESPRNTAGFTLAGATAQIEYRPLLNQEKRIELKLQASISFIGGFYSSTLNNNVAPDSIPITLLPYTSLRTFKIGAMLRYNHLSAFVHILGRYKSTTTPLLNVAGTVSNQPFELVNLYLKYRILDKRCRLDVFAQVRNLFNARYYNIAETAAFYMQLVPQDPTRISVGISASLGK